MKKTLSVILFAALLLSCSPKFASLDSDEQFLYIEVDADGQATGTLRISNLRGEEINEISLPDAEGKQVISAYPTRTAGITIVRRALPDEGKVITYWLNAFTGELLQLDFEGSYYFSSFIDQQLSRYTVLETVLESMPLKLRYQLIDLDTGETTDLTSLIAGIPGNLQGEFSVDESQLLLYSSDGIWLVPSGEPEKYQQISSSRGSLDPSFSPDGKKIVYAQKDDDDFSVFIYTIGEQEPQTVLTSSDRVVFAGFHPTQDEKLFVGKPDHFSLLNIASGEEQDLLQETVSRMMISPSGGHALFISFDKSHWIDLNTLEVGEMVQLEGMSLWSGIYSSSSNDWVFYDETEVNTITAFRAFNLETGQVQDITEPQDAITTQGIHLKYLPAATTSSVLLGGINENYQMVAWAINCDKGLTFELDAGDDPYSNAFSLGGVSQDEAFGIYSVIKRGENQSPMVIAIDMNTGKTVPITTGVHPIWLVKE